MYSETPNPETFPYRKARESSSTEGKCCQDLLLNQRPRRSFLYLSIVTRSNSSMLVLMSVRIHRFAEVGIFFVSRL